MAESHLPWGGGMRSREEIVKRIGVLTASIGKLQDEIYDMALEGRRRRCIWDIYDISRKMARLYSELQVLEWVLAEKAGE